MATVNYLKARAESSASGGLPPVAAYTIPVTSGLIGAWLMTGGPSLLTRNYATGVDQGIITGTPEVIDRTMRFGGNCYMDTLVEESTVRSVLAICKRSPSGNTMAPFGSTAIGDGGIGMYTPTSSMVLRVGAVGGNVDTTVATVNGGLSWGAYAAVIPATGGRYQLHNLTAGVSATSLSTADQLNAGGQTVLMGSLRQTPEGWDTQMLALLVSTTLWSTEDLALLKAWAKSYAADFGIVV